MRLWVGPILEHFLSSWDLTNPESIGPFKFFHCGNLATQMWGYWARVCYLNGVVFVLCLDPHDGVRPFHQKSTRLMQFTLGPHLVT
jgi:hypothetical protein